MKKSDLFNHRLLRKNFQIIVMHAMQYKMPISFYNSFWFWAEHHSNNSLSFNFLKRDQLQLILLKNYYNYRLLNIRTSASILDIYQFVLNGPKPADSLISDYFSFLEFVWDRHPQVVSLEIFNRICQKWKFLKGFERDSIHPLMFISFLDKHNLHGCDMIDYILENFPECTEHLTKKFL